MNEAKFCRQCGHPISQGKSFCEACGTPVDASRGPVTSPSLSQPLPHQPITQEMPPQHVLGGEKKKNGAPALLFVLIGLMLLLFALRFPLLSIAGKQTAAVVTDTRQLVHGSSDRMDNNYRITYSYMAENGDRYQSSYQMNKVLNISNLPRVNSTMRVRYLPALPQVSVPVSQEDDVLGILGTGVLGLFLIVLGMMGMGSKNKRSARR